MPCSTRDHTVAVLLDKPRSDYRVGATLLRMHMIEDI